MYIFKKKYSSNNSPLLRQSHLDFALVHPYIFRLTKIHIQSNPSYSKLGEQLVKYDWVSQNIKIDSTICDSTPYLLGQCSKLVFFPFDGLPFKSVFDLCFQYIKYFWIFNLIPTAN